MKKLNGEEPRKLAALTVSKAKPREKKHTLSDGYGLSLLVEPNGAKYWRYNYRFAGKQKTLALGVFPEISLSDARKTHREAYNLVADGIDPAEARRAERQASYQAQINSFEAITVEWLDVHMTDKSEGHKIRSNRILRTKLFPYIGKRSISDITAPELLNALRSIEKAGSIDTAHRARGLASQVYSYAIATGRAERNVANDLLGTLRPHQQKHRAAITDEKELGKLLRDMECSSSGIIVKTAMQISPILFQRPGEIRQMEWSEIDLDKAIWSIPATKMKMRNDHIVPLPRQAVALLKDLYPLTSSGKYVFPSARGRSRCLSENGVRTALRDMGYGNETVTPHGFRATARTLLDEVLGYRVDWIEAQLAHAVKDPTGRAYNRTQFLTQRIEMMQSWADYLDKLQADSYPASD